MNLKNIFSMKHLKHAVTALATTITISTSATFADAPASTAQTTASIIKMWNGNKTSSRQVYEQQLLEAVLSATKAGHGDWKLLTDVTDYPIAAEEGSVFREKGFDIFGTVMGNVKLAQEKKIIISQPIMKGLLGYRILIIRDADKQKFAAIKTPKQLQKLRLGIPATWADAELFRKNGYTVVEKGSFDELFNRLRNNEFDYVSFGANEVNSVFSERAAAGGGLTIDSSLLVYYPFPLVFYVNPDNTALAERVSQGLKTISANGELDKIFNSQYGELLENLQLQKRQLISLKNPVLPKEMTNFKPVLIKQ